MRLIRHNASGASPGEVAALYLAADEARWLAEERGLSSYWEAARILTSALPDEIAKSMDYCWAHAGVLVQETEGDRGYYRRLLCHAAYLKDAHPQVYEALTTLAAETREARACAAATPA